MDIYVNFSIFFVSSLHYFNNDIASQMQLQKTDLDNMNIDSFIEQFLFNLL